MLSHRVLSPATTTSRAESPAGSSLCLCLSALRPSPWGRCAPGHTARPPAGPVASCTLCPQAGSSALFDLLPCLLLCPAAASMGLCFVFHERSSPLSPHNPMGLTLSFPTWTLSAVCTKAEQSWTPPQAGWGPCQAPRLSISPQHPGPVCPLSVSHLL